LYALGHTTPPYSPASGNPYIILLQPKPEKEEEEEEKSPFCYVNQSSETL
jgi:hypothetical protein